jgi:dihydropteroate synthase
VGAALFSRAEVTILGVLNVTPDSFSDGGRFLCGGEESVDREAAVAAGEELARCGAHVLDVGGESTRPGAAAVSAEREIARTVPIIEALAKKLPTPISIDTQKAEVAEAALEAGARVVNDVSGLRSDPLLAKVVAEHDAWLILGHMRGTPRTMMDAPRFEDVLAEVGDELEASVRCAEGAGVMREKIVVDPGLGFGKSAEDTLRLLAHVDVFRARFDLPVLIGASRKSFLGAVTGASVEAREVASTAANAIGIFAGADAVRVHDVGAAVQAVAVAKALRDARGIPQ